VENGRHAKGALPLPPSTNYFPTRRSIPCSPSTPTSVPLFAYSCTALGYPGGTYPVNKPPGRLFTCVMHAPTDRRWTRAPWVCSHPAAPPLWMSWST
jgi:hypothetical protein